MEAGTVTMYPRTEMLDVIVVDGRARGIVTRNLVTGEIDTHIADAVILGTGGYGNVYYLVDKRQRIKRDGLLARAQTRSAVCESLLHADSSDLHSGFGRLSIEADADEREPAERRPYLGAEGEGRQAASGSDSGR